MQKFFVIFVLLCTFFLISCGGGSSKPTNESGGGDSVSNFGKLGQECYPNKSCDEGLLCDTDNNICIEDPENPINDSDITDSGSDGEPDTGFDSDGGDSAPDNGDSEPDDDADMSEPEPDEDADTIPVSDDDTDSFDPELNFPECSPTGETPCIDPNTLLVWSARSTGMLWSNAFEYCNNLDEGGYTDWRLPDLTILYTLVRNCFSQQECPCIGDTCTPSSCYFTSCSSNSEGYYSIFGETAFLWSSLAYGDSEALGVSFADGGIKNKSVINTMGNVRCVRIATTSVIAECTEIPEHAVYNTASEITLTWDWANYWTPSLETTYNEEPSTTECRFKCEDNYFWDSSTEECVISPCSSNPCGEYSDVVCMAITPEEFSCDCINGYYWWGKEKGCMDKRRLTLGNICTGQNKCYNNNEDETITCPTSESADFFGQDAYYANLGKCAPQSFTSSSNVIVDNNTGLTWEKSPSTDTYTWDNRATHCNDLNSSNYDGKNNWRVPNPLELLTIVDNSTYDPATNSNFTGMPTGEDDTYPCLWTNKEYNGDTNYAYVFGSSNGEYYGYLNSYVSVSKTYTCKILCVSGNELVPATSSDFVASSDGKTVTDNRTGLMWQKEYATDKTWKLALKYCEDLTYAGYSDWRLPNKNELASLVNYEKSASPYSYFQNMPSTYFWSSSTLVGWTSYAWYVNFGSGNVDFYINNDEDLKNKQKKYYVRCVR